MYWVLFTALFCWTTIETLTGRMCTYCPSGNTIIVSCIGG
jgi:hypothetical protein